MSGDCSICDAQLALVKCSCGRFYCDRDGCWGLHRQRKPDHQRAPSGSGKITKALDWAFLTRGLKVPQLFEKDETAKWFGLLEESNKNSRSPIYQIWVTPRFSVLMEESSAFKPQSPKQQFPCLVSFVGPTGAGKSSLIRGLVSQVLKDADLKKTDAPVSGVEHSFQSTTGEVNLYSDPESFGTHSPRLYIDCEGLEGTTPAAAQHQKKWSKDGKGYHICQKENGEKIDRGWAVKNIYPKFVYMFSDVICYVTQESRSWTNIEVNLLEWAKIGAQYAVNQYALPAVILILNAPREEDPAWISEDTNVLTEKFLNVVEDQIQANKFISELAKRYNVDSMRDLFMRSFSDIHVLYVPLRNFGELGTDANISRQYGRLLHRIKSDADRVQVKREKSWMRFDVQQLTKAFHHAFNHLGSRSTKPFDFSDCRAQTDLPKSTQSHVAEFLKCSLRDSTTGNFTYASSVLGSCMVVQALREEGPGLLTHPDAIYQPSMREICQQAIESYLDTGLRCNYIDSSTGIQCVNSKQGHSKGHQAENGDLLGTGGFKGGGFDSTQFQRNVTDHIVTFSQDLNKKAEFSQKREFAHARHRSTLQSSTIWVKTTQSIQSNTKTCFGCLFNAPSYLLPCGHMLCELCIKDFDQSEEDEAYPSRFIHHDCLLCSEGRSAGWQARFRVAPPLSGLRILSLDGGGVRGIVQIVTLKRIQSGTKLPLPIGAYFDLMVGTSVGGMVALGIGDHYWTAEQCIEKFEAIVQTGFVSKFLANVNVIGWLVRWFTSSIYMSDAFESALKTRYGESAFFGLDTRDDGHAIRVAVTTTVGRQMKLLANYRRSGAASLASEYLDSASCTWVAARSTSAAPMYFEAFENTTAGVICRDGGLKYNNPVEVAVHEAKAIWGASVTFDAIVSLGSGKSTSSPDHPWQSGSISEHWIQALFNSLMAHLNGEEQWDSWYARCEELKPRVRRLNVKFTADKEPALDDVDKVPDMKADATQFKFYKPASEPSFTNPRTRDQITEIALRLRASLFFFHPKKISYSKTVAEVTGLICCRLESVSDAFKSLCNLTDGFEMPGPPVSFPPISDCIPRFLLEISFQYDVSLSEQPIQIAAKFKDGFLVPISGFPTTFESIKKALEKES